MLLILLYITKNFKKHLIVNEKKKITKSFTNMLMQAVINCEVNNLKS